MSKDPPNSGVDICIIQLYREGMIETTWYQIHPQSYLALVKWLDAVADKGS
jgi:hypothetical protein